LSIRLRINISKSGYMSPVSGKTSLKSATEFCSRIPGSDASGTPENWN